MRDLVAFQEIEPVIMGIVNTTPDSFSDGGQYECANAAVDHALKMVEDGAHIVDVGGESTRPGAAFVEAIEEIDRVVPIIEAIAKTSNTCISVDTRKPEVAAAAVRAGAHIWNDVSALTFSPESLPTAAKLGVPIILMHAQGTPETMQDKPEYRDVLREVLNFLEQRIAACENAGIPAEKIVLDPGIGFGKSVQHNLDLIKGLGVLQQLGCPVLLGASRKSFIAKIDRDEPAHSRIGGSIAAAMVGYQAGARWFRVHDVGATRQALSILQSFHAF